MDSGEGAPEPLIVEKNEFTLRFSNFRLETNPYQLFENLNGRDTLLSEDPTLLGLLWHIFTSPGLHNKHVLQEKFYKDSKNPENSLAKGIEKARKLIRDNPPRYLLTRHGSGYEFKGEVREVKQPERLTFLRIKGLNHNPQLIPTRPGYNFVLDKYKMASLSSEIDMMGWNLYREWISEPLFIDTLERRVREKKLCLRIILSLPDSPFIQLLCRNMDSVYQKEGTRVKESAELKERLDKSIKRLREFPQHEDILLLVADQIIFTGMVRMDNVMLLTMYQSSRRGSTAPAIVIQKTDFDSVNAEFFDVWKGYFDELWDRLKKS